MNNSFKCLIRLLLRAHLRRVFVFIEKGQSIITEDINTVAIEKNNIELRPRSMIGVILAFTGSHVKLYKAIELRQLIEATYTLCVK